MQRRSPLLVAAATSAALAVAAVLLAALVVYGGFYDVAATRQHWQLTYDILDIAMRRSVRLHARAIAEPPLADEPMALRGAACFRDKCVQCHGAPGVGQEDIGKSMQPIPSSLLDGSKQWRPRELYWIVRNGIKTTGMPAWEFRLSEAETWDTVAFLRRLPQLDGAGYTQWMQRAASTPSCGRDPGVRSAGPVDVERGRLALYQYACHGCHTIPGVTGSSPTVGPVLQGVASRQVIAGTIVNTPENLLLWIMQPQKLKPGSAMPSLGVTQQDARDMAAYLATVR